MQRAVSATHAVSEPPAVLRAKVKSLRATMARGAGNFGRKRSRIRQQSRAERLIAPAADRLATTHYGLDIVVSALT